MPAHPKCSELEYDTEGADGQHLQPSDFLLSRNKRDQNDADFILGGWRANICFDRFVSPACGWLKNVLSINSTCRFFFFLIAWVAVPLV